MKQPEDKNKELFKAARELAKTAAMIMNLADRMAIVAGYNTIELMASTRKKRRLKR